MKSSRTAIRGRNMLSNSNSTPSPASAASLYEHQGDSAAGLEAYQITGWQRDLLQLRLQPKFIGVPSHRR
jgi:hypothetical protein